MLLSITKNEIIYSLYISSFEQIKKYLDKKDSDFPTIQKCCDNLNQSKNILTEDNNLEKYSLILINILDNSSIKIFEIIIKLFEEVLKNNLIDDIILQKIIPKLLNKINNYLENKEINYKLYQKILAINEMIYNNKNIFIHNNNLKTILEICIKISNKDKENNNNKPITYQTLISIIKKIFGNLSLNSNRNNSNINNISLFVNKYINFLIDLIIIQSNLDNNNINIINKYINIISNNNNNIKEELEKLNLDKLNIYKNKEKIKIDKYGWCIWCNKGANKWNEELNFPICNIYDCEKNLKNILSNEIYYINDYFDIIIFLSNVKSDNIKTIELCLEIIKEMIKSGIKYFKKDIKMIEIIKSIFKEFILKNALSQNIKIFKLSLDIFNLIFINYRQYLKTQIELFFMKIFINVLESEKRPFNYKEIIINDLFFLLDKIDINFLIEIYINYDCDSKFNAIFCVLINLFTKIKSGLYQQNKYSNTFKNLEEINIIIYKILDFLNIFTNGLNNFLTKKIVNYDLINIDDNNNCETYNEFITYLNKNNMIASEELFNQMKLLYIDDYNNNTIKKDYSNIFQKENKSNNLISYILNIQKGKLSQVNYQDYISYEIAYFLHTKENSNSLKLNINDILYNEKQSKVLYYYIEIISSKFKDKNELESLRILFSFLPFTDNEKIINNIILIFSQIYYDINPNNESININEVYYLSFLLYKLNKNFNNEKKEKISKENFIKEIEQYININKENNIINTYINYYNQIEKEPLIFKSHIYNKENKIEKKEDLYITEININDIKQFIEFSWNNFLNMKIQIINESINKKNKEIFFDCLNQVLTFIKICGILNIKKAQENYLNVIISLINLDEKAEINETIYEIIIKLMNYINDNCTYIKSGWNKILKIISLLEYYLLEPESNIILNLRNSKINKFTEKEIKTFLNKRDNLSSNISDAICESIFSKTELLENEVIIDFIQNLCLISQFELDSYYIPRLFSLNKLVELIHFNLFRSQFCFRKIWIIISQYLGNIIIKNNKEDIWKHALDILKQIIIKIFEKKEYLDIKFKFQEELFFIFENIFKEIEINKETMKEETIIDIICFIITQYGKNINNGWNNILNLIKLAFNINNTNINNNIINILNYINNNSKIIFNNNNLTIFENYIEYLCFIYNQKSMKHIAFEVFTSILNKIIDNENMILKIPSVNKIYKFIQILFYNIDTLLKINIIEYLNLLFEIINHNKNILLSESLNIYLYIYYVYFKPNISLFILSKYKNRINFLNIAKDNKNNIYNYLSTDSEIKLIQSSIEYNINTLINDFGSKEGKEYDEIFYNNDKKNKIKVCGFLEDIKKEINNEKFKEYINKGINNIKDIDDNNYEMLIKYFFEKFKNMFNKENNYINYNYFYSDLILTIQQLSIFNSNSDLIYRILFKIISSCIEDISIYNKNKLIENNYNILKIISSSEINTINEKDIFKYLKYILDFANYFLEFIQLFQFDFIKSFKLILKLFNNILLLDIKNENNLDKYKIINSSSIIVLLMKLQDIQLYILNKTKKENLIKIKKEKNDTIIYLNQIYEKYLINKDVNSLINKIYIFELENLLPKFVEFFNENELDITYQCLINLISSINHDIRKGAKNILKFLVENKFIILTKINK